MKSTYTSSIRYFDNKDAQISALQSEILELKQNERDFNDISNQLRNLEHRYTILHEEKLRIDEDFTQKNQKNLNLIATLKTDIDTLKIALQEKSFEAQQMYNELNEVKNSNKDKEIEIRKLQEQIMQYSEEINSLHSNINGQSQQLQQTLNEKTKLQQQLAALTEKLNKLGEQYQSQEKSNKQFVFQISNLESKLNEVEGNYFAVANENKVLNSTIQQQEMQLLDQQGKIGRIEDALRQLEEVKEKLYSESSLNYRNYQNEIAKNNELMNEFSNLSQLAKNKDSQIEQLKGELQRIKQLHSETLENNQQLDSEVEDLQIQVKKLIQQLQSCIEQAQESGEIDEQIKLLLSRKKLPQKFESIPRFPTTTSPNSRIITSKTSKLQFY